MDKKMNLAIILVSLVFVVLGFLYLYNNILFYKQSSKTLALITSITEPDNCAVINQCKFGRKLILKINNINVSESKEVSIFTAISGIFTVGNQVEVLYQKKISNTPVIAIFGNDARPILYEVKIYTWHYWGYPVLIILFGILIYFVGKKLLREKSGALEMPLKDNKL